MEQTYEITLKTFTEESLPDLDTAVLGALELFARTPLPEFAWETEGKTAVLGSENALSTGKMLFTTPGTIFLDENNYHASLHACKNTIDRAVVISASGGKDAVAMAQVLHEKGISTWLLTCNENAIAQEYVDASQVCIFPKNREPYTYNTSTYLGMLLARTSENPEAIYKYIVETVLPRIPETLGAYDAFYCVVPDEMTAMGDMIRTKFDELFGARVSGRVFSESATRHAKTIVPSDTEYFVHIGETEELFGTSTSRMQVPLPADAGPAMLMAIGYAIVGAIQKQHPPYFKENISNYAERASQMFGQRITTIVE